MLDKATNMKRAWNHAKGMQEQSGWGLTAEDNEELINARLEQRCAFFWRLEEIWGTRPYVTIHALSESLNRAG